MHFWELPLKKNKNDEEGGNIFSPTPFNMKIILAVFVFIIIIIYTFLKKRNFGIKQLIFTIIASYVSSESIVICTFGPIYYGLYDQTYPGIDHSNLLSYIAFGGFISLIGIIYLLYTFMISDIFKE